jgi:Zn-finger nucleic acid-binding protein
MNCPSCGAEMSAQMLEGHLGVQVQIDSCADCQAFWFDHLESVKLSPAATLGLFRMISDQSRAAPKPLREPLACPRCDLRLLLTHDRQRNTPFRYWRCAREHGRLITFFDFLREKDFIRPLSPQQLAELRQNLQIVNCSNCGAPIDIVHGSDCAHCGTPVSMLDVKHISEMANRSKKADGAQPPAARGDIDALVDAMRAHQEADHRSANGLVEAGLRLIGRWLTSS